MKNLALVVCLHNKHFILVKGNSQKEWSLPGGIVPDGVQSKEFLANVVRRELGHQTFLANMELVDVVQDTKDGEDTRIEVWIGALFGPLEPLSAYGWSDYLSLFMFEPLGRITDSILKKLRISGKI